jgi:hypothetical protein
MQSALPLAKEMLLHLRRLVPSPLLCPLPLFHHSIGGKSAPASALAPLGGVRGQPRLRGIRCIFSALFCSVSVRDCTAGSSDTLRRSLHGTGPALSSKGANAGLGCCSTTSESARRRPSAAIVKVVFRHPSCKNRVLSVACNTAGSRLQVVAVRPAIHQQPRRRRRIRALRSYRYSLPPPSLSLSPSPPPTVYRTSRWQGPAHHAACNSPGLLAALSILQKNSIGFLVLPSRAHAHWAAPEWSRH